MASIAPFSGAPPAVRSGIAARAPRWPFRIRTDLAAELGITFWWPLNAPGWFPLWRRRTAPTLNGTPKLTPWAVSGATAFKGDGSSQFIDHNVTGSSLGLSSAGYTIACWLEPSAIDIEWQAVWAFGEGGKPRLARLSGGTALNWQPGGGSSRSTASGTLVVGTPHHVICTKNGSSGKIFVDGAVGASGSAGNPDTTGDFYIGENPDATGRWWEGYIGDVIVANRGWSDAECKRLFDPTTRWALYDRRPPVSYSFPSVLRTRAEIDAPLKTFGLVGYAPTVTAINDTIIDVPKKTFDMAGQAPAIATGINVVSPAKALDLSGIAAAVGTSALVNVPFGAFPLSGCVPAVATGVGIMVPLQAFVRAGQIPNTSTGVSIAAPAHAYSLTGSAPTVGTGANIAAPLKTYLLSGTAPTVLARAWTEVVPVAATWTKVAPVSTTWTRLN